MDCNPSGAHSSGQQPQDVGMDPSYQHQAMYGGQQRMQQDHQMMQPSVHSRMHHMVLKDADVKCEYICSTMYKYTGVILQFVNNASVGSATVIGGIRLKVTDITEVPAYLARNKVLVKNHAMKQLQHHLQDTQCPLGLGETLAADDFGISYMVASLTPRAGLLHPYERKEGPLFYCLFPGLVEPVYLRQDVNGAGEWAYIINVYINLLEAGKRRSYLAMRMHQEDQARREELAHLAQLQNQQNQGGNKKQKTATGAGRRTYQHQQQQQQQQANLAAGSLPLLVQIAEGVDRMERDRVIVPNYPPLPTAEARIWPENEEDSAMNMPEK